MAVSSHGFIGTQKFEDINANASVESLLDGATTLFSVEMDNTENDSAVFVGIYDLALASPPTVGTTEPDYCFKVAAGEKRFQPMSADGAGLSLSAGLHLAAVTDKGCMGSNAPVNAVKVTLVTN